MRLGRVHPLAFIVLGICLCANVFFFGPMMFIACGLGMIRIDTTTSGVLVPGIPGVLAARSGCLFAANRKRGTMVAPKLNIVGTAIPVTSQQH